MQPASNEPGQNEPENQHRQRPNEYGEAFHEAVDQKRPAEMTDCNSDDAEFSENLKIRNRTRATAQQTAADQTKRRIQGSEAGPTASAGGIQGAGRLSDATNAVDSLGNDARHVAQIRI